ncbi:MAG TPA: hypothetical protein PKC19_23425, partial [Roseiflexaceae bacterium]|nr:hypothetical protein [Roseiflexaceae bacterium]
RYEQLAYMRAHEAVARELRASTMQYGIVMPTGFFAALLPLLDFARRGVGLVIGDGSARSNPIHEADLALVCADLVGESGMHEIEAGGPQVLTRREMTELAFAALQRPPRLMHAPPWLPRFYAFMARPFAPRLSELMAFAGAMFTSDGVATPRGSRTLGDYFSAAAGHTAG